MINEEILKACRKMERTAQRVVYNHLLPRLYGTCRRYLKSQEDIEDVLSETFYTIFTKINQLKDDGALEAWARKITVNHCLLVLKKSVDFIIPIDTIPHEPLSYTETPDSMAEKDLMQLLSLLPEGCRTIFNLYAIEGYSHKEIASMLHISEGTSKSQLNFSRNKLKVMINEVGLYKTK